jgi:hypothetical protein
MSLGLALLALVAAQGERSRPVVDVEWLEVGARAGFAVFSEDFETDPAPSLALAARAPMPWLSPASSPDGEWFGAFVQVALAPVEREVEPGLEEPDGTAWFFTAGLDFTLVRDGTWLLMLQAGPQYQAYGGISDLDDGFAAQVGARAGLDLSRGVSLTFSPDLAFGNAGDRVTFLYLGVLIDF